VKAESAWEGVPADEKSPVAAEALDVEDSVLHPRAEEMARTADVAHGLAKSVALARSNHRDSRRWSPYHDANGIDIGSKSG